MVLESLITPFKAEKKPWDMLFLGFLFTVVAIFLAMWVFKTYTSLVMVFFTVMACLPFMIKTMRFEERKDTVITDEMTLLKEHSKALACFMFLFLGMVLAYALFFIILPNNMTQNIYYSQIQTISNVNAQLSANYVNPFETFTNILFNNLRVLSFCILFSFAYGAGAIFILTWNASVIGTAVGNFIRTKISIVMSQTGMVSLGNYFYAVSFSLLRYFIHGIPEILAYLIGGLAGGIISFAVIRHDFASKKFENIIMDTSELIILALFLLLLSSFIEVYLTPLLF